LDGDPPERRLRAVAPRRAEDRRREDLTDVFRLAWEHGVNGQAQVIKGMQQIIHSYTLLQDKEAMSEAVANVRWLIAAGIRDFQAMPDELAKLQADLPRDAQHPTSPATTTRLPDRGHRPGRGLAGGGAMRTPAVRFDTGRFGVGVMGARRDEEWAPP
jgi:hypothetical protein